MSHKTSRRSRRQTNDEETSSVKSASPKTNGEETPPIDEEPPNENSAKTEQLNGKPEKEQNGTEKETEMVMTRSRSQTPQKKKIDEQEQPEIETVITEESEITAENCEVVAENHDDMDPLMIADEPDPELVFEENSSESEKGSPAVSRCKTRRSSLRNIPTPKTPKLLEEETEAAPPVLEMETEVTENGESESHNDLNNSFESCSEDVSTKAQVGGDSTRLEYTDKESSSLENNAFLASSKDKSFGEALRHLSTRRSLRPLGDDYRKRVLQNNLDKNDLNSTYPKRHSIERLSVGMKRKNSSEPKEESTKRFKSDSPGFFSRFTSPLATIRSSFRSDIVSSTPKLTGYKDEKFLLEGEEGNSKLCKVKDGEKRWCSIM